MGLFSKLFKSKKKEEKRNYETDGQEKFFKEGEAVSTKITKEESSPVKTDAKQATVEKPKAEEKPAAPAEKKAPKANPAVTKKPVAKVEPKPVKVDDEDDENQREDDEVADTKTTRNGKFDIRKSKDGRYYFSLYASNKQVIAYSQMYSSITSAMNGIKSVIANASKASVEDTTLKKPNPQSFPKWEIYIDKAGEHRFRLYASNGSCICHSHGYATKATCKGGMESIQRFASESADIDKTYLKK